MRCLECIVGILGAFLGVLGGVGCISSEVECSLGGFVCLFGVHRRS